MDQNGIHERMKDLEARSEASERSLSTSISKLTGEISNLCIKIESFVEFHQKYTIMVLLVVSAIFFGKEILVHYLAKV